MNTSTRSRLLWEPAADCRLVIGDPFEHDGYKAGDDLRRVVIHDQADRDAIASQLLRYCDERRDDWAGIIDMLTLHPEARRKGCEDACEMSVRGEG